MRHACPMLQSQQKLHHQQPTDFAAITCSNS